MNTILWTCELCGKEKPKTHFRKVFVGGRLGKYVQPCADCNRKYAMKKPRPRPENMRGVPYVLTHDPHGTFMSGAEFSPAEIVAGLGGYAMGVPCWYSGTVFVRAGREYTVVDGLLEETK